MAVCRQIMASKAAKLKMEMDRPHANVRVRRILGNREFVWSGLAMTLVAIEYIRLGSTNSTKLA